MWFLRSLSRLVISGAMLLMCGLAGPMDVSWAFSMNVDPPRVEARLVPGQTISGTIQLANTGDAPMSVRAYVQDWVYDDEGGKTFLPPGSTGTSCATWIHLTPSELVLPPQSTANVRYTVTSPRDATGGHVAVIFFESDISDQPTENNVSLLLAGRIGTIVYHETVNRSQRLGDITALEVQAPGPTRSLQASVTFENRGDVHVRSTGTINIIGADGRYYGKTAVPEIRTLPGESRTAVAEWFGTLSPGPYVAVVTMDYGEDYSGELPPAIAEQEFVVQ